MRPSHYSNHFALLSAGEPTPEKTKESLAGRFLQQPLPLREVAGGLEAAERGQKTLVQPWGKAFGNQDKANSSSLVATPEGSTRLPFPLFPSTSGSVRGVTLLVYFLSIPLLHGCVSG